MSVQGRAGYSVPVAGYRSEEVAAFSLMRDFVLALPRSAREERARVAAGQPQISQT